MNIAYTGLDTADGFRQAMIAETKRRIEAVEQSKHRARTKRDQAYQAGELSSLKGMLTTLEQMTLECTTS